MSCTTQCVVSDISPRTHMSRIFHGVPPECSREHSQVQRCQQGVHIPDGTSTSCHGWHRNPCCPHGLAFAMQFCTRGVRSSARSSGVSWNKVASFSPHCRLTKSLRDKPGRVVMRLTLLRQVTNCVAHFVDSAVVIR